MTAVVSTIDSSTSAQKRARQRARVGRIVGYANHRSRRPVRDLAKEARELNEWLMDEIRTEARRRDLFWDQLVNEILNDDLTAALFQDAWPPAPHPAARPPHPRRVSPLAGLR